MRLPWGFLNAIGVDTLQVCNLEDKRASIPANGETDSICLIEMKQSLHEGVFVHDTDIDAIVRMCLRESIWCKLQGDIGAYVHFGYDYYMYIGCSDCDSSLTWPTHGVFTENMPSPYM